MKTWTSIAIATSLMIDIGLSVKLEGTFALPSIPLDNPVTGAVPIPTSLETLPTGTAPVPAPASVTPVELQPTAPVPAPTPARRPAPAPAPAPATPIESNIPIPLGLPT